MVAWQNDFITYLMTYYPFFGDKELPDGVDYDDVFGLWCLLGRYRRSDFPAGKSNVVYQVEKLKKEIEKLTEEKQALADQLLQERDDKWLEQKLRTCGSMLELVNKAVATADTANIASMKERIQQLEAENNKLKKRKRRC